MSIREALEAHRLRVTTPQYHAHPALSCSRFLSAGLYTEDESLWTPLDYAFPGNPPSGDALDFGTVVHALVYEPDTLSDIMAVRPTRGGKLVAINTQEYGEWSLIHAGKIHLHPDAWENARSCAKSVDEEMEFGGPHCAYAGLEILSTEACYVVDEPITGLQIRIKPDRLRIDKSGVIICEDLKTTSKSCAPQQFGWACRDFNYWRRAAFYRYALRLITGTDAVCTMLVVEKSAPHRVALYEMRTKMDEAEAQNEASLRALRRCSDAFDFTPTWAKELYAI